MEVEEARMVVSPHRANPDKVNILNSNSLFLTSHEHDLALRFVGAKLRLDLGSPQESLH
jgi:hypothetical protein